MRWYLLRQHYEVKPSRSRCKQSSSSPEHFFFNPFYFHWWFFLEEKMILICIFQEAPQNDSVRLSSASSGHLNQTRTQRFFQEKPKQQPPPFASSWFTSVTPHLLSYKSQLPNYTAQDSKFQSCCRFFAECNQENERHVLKLSDHNTVGYEKPTSHVVSFQVSKFPIKKNIQF